MTSKKIKIRECTGDGQGICKGCADKGKWNRYWMCFLYKIDGLPGLYCGDCVREFKEKMGKKMRIVDRENNEVQIIVRLKADLKSALDDMAETMSVSRNLLMNEIIAKAILNFNYGKEESINEKIR